MTVLLYGYDWTISSALTGDATADVPTCLTAVKALHSCHLTSAALQPCKAKPEAPSKEGDTQQSLSCHTDQNHMFRRAVFASHTASLPT